MSCFYTVIAPADLVISFTFSQFATESCCDFFEIYDGRTSTATRIFRGSGNTIPGRVLTTGPFAHVRWTTDYSIIAAGVTTQIEFMIPPSPTPTITPTTSSTPSLSPTMTRTMTLTATGSMTASVSMTASITPSTSITPSITPSSSRTPSGTPAPSPEFTLLASASRDFANRQGFNGWSYGYYLSSAAAYRILYKNTEFSVGSNIFLYAGSYCRLGATYLHPNAGYACSTTGYGYCMPSLQWTTTTGQQVQYSYYKIRYDISHSHGCGDGVKVQLLADGQILYQDIDSVGIISSSRTFTRPSSLSTIELRQDPNGGCDCDQVSYTLEIYGSLPSPSVTPSISGSPSITSSITPSTSSSPSYSPSETPDPSYEYEDPSYEPSYDPFDDTFFDPSISPSASSSVTGSSSITSTLSNSVSPSISPTMSTTVSQTVSSSITRSSSITSTLSNSVSASVTGSPTASTSVSPSITGSSSITSTASISVSPSVSMTVTGSPSISSSASNSASLSVTGSSSITSSASNSASLSVTGSPSITSTASNSASLSVTGSPSISSSASNSASLSVTGSPSITSTPSNSASLSVTGSPSITSTPSNSASLSVTGSPSITSTASNSASPSVSMTVTGSSSISSSASNSVSPTITGSPSITSTASNSASPSVSMTVTGSSSITSTPSNSASLSVTGSSSITSTPSNSASLSVTGSPTTSTSVSPSLSISPTRSPSTTLSPVPLTEFISQINEIPLTNFTNNVITDILSVFAFPQQQETVNGSETGNNQERIQPPYELLAAGFFATNPDAEPITISTDTITLTIAKLNTSTTTVFGSEDSPIVIPPLPIPQDAIVYVSNTILSTTEMSVFNLTSNSTSIGVVSLTGKEYEVSNLQNPITVGFGSTAVNTTEQECSYWNTSIKSWSSDGCTLIVDSAGQAMCECTHLTEFALRFRAIAAINAGIINSLDKLLTLEGLKAAAPIIGLLGGIGFILLIIIGGTILIDRRASRRFAYLLDHTRSLEEVKERIRISINDSWDSLSTAKGPFRPYWHRKVGIPTIPKTICGVLGLWIRRIPYNHPWLALFFRFEPGLPRLFRAIFIVASFITTISVSILFYGYRHADTDAALELSETIVLSLMTTAVSMPLTKIMMKLMYAAGRYEFRGRYGYLATELIKRQNFLKILKKLEPEDLMTELETYEQQMNRQLEVLAGEWISGQGQGEEDDRIITAQAAQAAAAANSTMDESVEEMAGIALLFDLFSICCKRSRDKLKKIFRQRMNLFITNYSNRPLIVSRLSRIVLKKWPSFPLHTNPSAVAILIVSGWIAWCYTYILGFTALKSSETTFTIVQTVAMSLFTSHFITQPLLQLTLLLIEYFKNKRLLPQENNFYYLHELEHKVNVDFVAECSLVPWYPHDDIRRSALICPISTLMKKVVDIDETSVESQTVEDKIRYIYEMLG